MINDIKDKLRIILDKDRFEETDVVYILSRIRKILEIDKKEKEFKKLKFYCDWALHSQIDNTDAMKDDLETFLRGSLEKGRDFLFFKPFDEEFATFLKEYSMSTGIYNNTDTELQFKQLLTRIYSDTPLIVKVTKKRKIVIKESKIGRQWATSFTITEE